VGTVVLGFSQRAGPGVKMKCTASTKADAGSTKESDCKVVSSAVGALVAPPPPPRLPDPFPPPPSAEAVMQSDDKGLNSECGKWRDNKNGLGSKKNLQLGNQMKQMAYCMAQDCAQSMEQITCRYTDESRLCYTNPGQIFCKNHAGHSKCQDMGAAVTKENLADPGAWAPLTSVPVFGSDPSSVGKSPYGCVCFKNCAHFTGGDVLKKYRCSGGVGNKLGMCCINIAFIAFFM